MSRHPETDAVNAGLTVNGESPYSVMRRHAERLEERLAEAIEVMDVQRDLLNQRVASKIFPPLIACGDDSGDLWEVVK